MKRIVSAGEAVITKCETLKLRHSVCQLNVHLVCFITQTMSTGKNYVQLAAACSAVIRLLACVSVGPSACVRMA